MNLLPRKWRKAVLARDSVPDDEFYERFYSDSGISKRTVCEIRDFIASEYSVQADKLLPSDRFAEELSAGRFWDWDNGYAILVFALTGAAKEKGVTVDREFETVDEFIRMLGQVYD